MSIDILILFFSFPLSFTDVGHPSILLNLFLFFFFARPLAFIDEYITIYVLYNIWTYLMNNNYFTQYAVLYIWVRLKFLK